MDMREQMAKRFDLLQRLEALRTGEEERDRMVDAFSDFVVEREIMMIRMEEALRDLDVAVKKICTGKEGSNVQSGKDDACGGTGLAA